MLCLGDVEEILFLSLIDYPRLHQHTACDFELGLDIQWLMRTEGECFSAFLEMEDLHDFCHSQFSPSSTIIPSDLVFVIRFISESFSLNVYIRVIQSSSHSVILQRTLKLT